MSGTATNVSELARSLKVEEKDLMVELNAKGALPSEIIGHTQAREYIIKGITPDDFITKHAAAEVDINDLQTKFRQMCEDYGSPLALDRPSKAVEFCSKIIFEIGPESRKVKKSEGDKVWKFKFPYTGEDGKPYVSCVFVCTFKADNTEYKQTSETRKMVLSVKQASLIAISTFNDLAELAYEKDTKLILLTPLAGAIFSKADIPALADKLSLSIPKTAAVINSSAQTGGHVLKESTTHCAAVCSIVATKGVKDEKVRVSIVSKVIKQYVSKGKAYKPEKFALYAKYAHGGVPAELSFARLAEQFDAAQAAKISTRQMATAVSQSVQRSIVTAPTPFQSLTVNK